MLSLVLTTGWAEAARVHYFDKDGTLFHDSGLNSKREKPAFWTYWVLKRVSAPNNGFGLQEFDQLVRDGTLPDRILVNRHEMDFLLADRLAVGEAQMGSLEWLDLMKDPIDEVVQSQRAGSQRYADVSRVERIIPGYYYVSSALSFRYHKDQVPGENVELESIRAAIERSRADSEFEWRGQAWPFLEDAIRKQDKVFLLTRRDITQESSDVVFGELEKARAVPALNGSFPVMASVTSVQSRRYGAEENFHRRKANRIDDDALKLLRSPLATHMTRSPSGRGKRKMHEIIVYENDPNEVLSLIVKLREAAGKYPDIKFSLYHAGIPEQVQGADFNRGVEKPSRRIVFSPEGVGWRRPYRGEFPKASNIQCESDLVEG